MHNTLRLNTNIKKFSSGKINVTKNALLFFCEVQPVTALLLINLQFLYELKHMVHLSKTVCEIFHFRFRMVIIKLYSFVQ